MASNLFTVYSPFNILGDTENVKLTFQLTPEQIALGVLPTYDFTVEGDNSTPTFAAWRFVDTSFQFVLNTVAQDLINLSTAIIGNASLNVQALSVVDSLSQRLLTTRQPAIADANAGTIVAQFNTLLAALRIHGLIAT